jgi:hypothetical protein
MLSLAARLRAVVTSRGLHGDFSIWNAGTNDFYIKQSTGNVGIGTTSPAQPLNVYGSTYFGQIGINAAGTNSEADIGFKSSNVSPGAPGNWLVGVNIGNSSGDFSIWNAGTNDFYIKQSTGNVGIGTTSPSYKLDISGSVRATGTMYAPAFTVTSDKRLKRKIATLPSDCIKLVQKLRPVSFDWKHFVDESMEGKQLGFVAQEVEEVLPSTISTQVDKKKSKGIKYNEIVVLLTKAIQEQQAQIEALREQLDEFKSARSRTATA